MPGGVVHRATSARHASRPRGRPVGPLSAPSARQDVPKSSILVAPHKAASPGHAMVS